MHNAGDIMAEGVGCSCATASGGKKNKKFALNSSVHAEHATQGSLHLFMRRFATQARGVAHRILVNPKHSFQLKFRHIPLIEGFAFYS